MKPTIRILESGKILLDRLNENEDFVEIDTKDIIFLRLLGIINNPFLDMAFLLDSAFVDIFKSNECFTTTELDNGKFLCCLNEKKVDLDWIFLGNICNYRKLPDNTYPYLICIRDTGIQMIYLNLDKVQKTIITNDETIGVTHHCDDNKMMFCKSSSNSKTISFYIKPFDSKFKGKINFDFMRHSFSLDENFIKMIKEQIHQPYRIKDKTTEDNLLHFLDAICPVEFKNLI